MSDEVSCFSNESSETCFSTESHGGIKRLVAKALSAADDDWRRMDTLEVQDLRKTLGTLGTRWTTFKVVGHLDGTPRAVILRTTHGAREVGEKDILWYERAFTAVDHLAKLGVGPKVLAKGEDWFIEAWEGEAIGTVTRLYGPDTPADKHATIAEIGALLAKVHKEEAVGSADWYEGLREKIKDAHPGLSIASPGSFIWVEEAKKALSGFSDDVLQQWITAMPEPFTKAGRRLVTCHGDFQPSNILRTPDRNLKVIDFECTVVSYAIWDIAWAFSLFIELLVERRSFVGAYLRASEMPYGEEEIDALLLDAHYCMLSSGMPFMRNQMQMVQHDPGYTLKRLDGLKQIVREAQLSPEKRSDIIEQSLVACAQAKEMETEWDEHERPTKVKLTIAKYAELKPALQPAMVGTEGPAAIFQCKELAISAGQASPYTCFDVNAAAGQFSCLFRFWLNEDQKPADYFNVCAAEVGTGLGDFRISWCGGLAARCKHVGFIFCINGNIGAPDPPFLGEGLNLVFGEPQAGKWTDGKWHHIGIVYDTSTGICELFVDGSPTDRQHFVLAQPVRLTKLSIGEQRAECEGVQRQQDRRWPPGQMCDVRIFLRALSQKEVLAERLGGALRRAPRRSSTYGARKRM